MGLWRPGSSQWTSCGLVAWSNSVRTRNRRGNRAESGAPLAADDQQDFQNDRERQNNIALLGWQVLHFTWLDLTEYPQRVIAEIRFATSHSAR